jgi:RNA polymerase sigma-70 factor, ECF subfamily
MDCLDRVRREDLLRSAVLAGNENAWRTWYDETFDELYRYVRWRCGGRRDWADEIVQETWLTAVRRVRRFDPRKGSFLAWLRGIAANLLRNDLRKRRRLPTFQQSADEQIDKTSGTESPWEDRQREEQVAAALDALPDREEAVLRAKYLEGLSVAQIASARGETPKAVESLLSRARQAFREVYREQGEGPCPSPVCGRGTGHAGMIENERA